jgi:ribosomal protein S18 acetylase RimI-like enzyme
MYIERAVSGQHKELMQIAKQTKWTKDFSNQMMFGACYERGWVLGAWEQEGGPIVGFACYRIKVRVHETTLYFVGVDAASRGRGVGTELIRTIMANKAAHRTMVLKCAKDNLSAKKYYDGQAFSVASEDDTYWVMRRQFS